MRLDRLISSAKHYILGGDNGQRVTYDTVAPTSPQNGDLWWEPGARYPQPWEFDTGNSQWMSQLVSINFNPITSVNQSTNHATPIWFYNTASPRVKLVSCNIFVDCRTQQTQGVNFYNFPLYYLLGTGAYTAIYTMPEDTGNNSPAMAAGGVRRINANIDLYLPGNAWNIVISQIAYGSPGTIIWSPTFWLRFARP